MSRIQPKCYSHHLGSHPLECGLDEFIRMAVAHISFVHDVLCWLAALHAGTESGLHAFRHQSGVKAKVNAAAPTSRSQCGA
jgi:hypothetical protein